MVADEEDWDFDAAADEDYGLNLLEDSEVMPPEMENEDPSPVLPIEKEVGDLAVPPVAEPVAAAQAAVAAPFAASVAEYVGVAAEAVAEPIAATMQSTHDPASPAVKTKMPDASTALVSGAPPDITPGLKRRRLSQKTSPDKAAAAGDLMGNLGRVVLPSSDQDWWLEMTAKEKHRWLGQNIRSQVVQTFHEQLSEKTKRAQKWRAAWRYVPDSHRAELVEHWVSTTKSGQECPDVVLEWFRGGEKEDRDLQQGSPLTRFQSKQLFLTYNGSWGEFMVKNLAKAGQSADQVAEALKFQPELVAYWAQARQEVNALSKELSASSWSMCFELCKRTWITKQIIRVHMHALLRRADLRFRVRSVDMLKVLGCRPFGTHEDLTRSKRASNHQAQYYCIAPKVGQIFSYSTDEPYVDFPVNAQWIWSLVQSEKITLEKAAGEFVKVANNLPRHLAHLRALGQVHEEREVARQIESKELLFRQQRCAFKRIPRVTAFMAAFKHVQSRHKFLVLDGPSRMGKTEFVRSLVEPVATLELNCASCLDPPFSDFRPSVHRLVLLDEGSVEMVLKNRKLFQCPNSKIQLATSATNCHSYSVYLNDCMLVVCSNSWAAQLAYADNEGAKWIEANQIYLHVAEPLWIRPEAGVSASVASSSQGKV